MGMPHNKNVSVPVAPRCEACAASPKVLVEGALAWESRKDIAPAVPCRGVINHARTTHIKSENVNGKCTRNAYHGNSGTNIA